jgi:hypothetical protein
MYCQVKFVGVLPSTSPESICAELPENLPASSSGSEKTTIWQLEVTFLQQLFMFIFHFIEKRSFSVERRKTEVCSWERGQDSKDEFTAGRLSN